MIYDPICQKYFTQIMCCSTAGKVLIINYYKRDRTHDSTWYAYPDGTYSDIAPAGLDCSC